MTNNKFKYWLMSLLVLISLIHANGQVSLTLTYGDPAASPELAFDGNVFQAGSEIGDVSFYAKFGGVGTRYFEIDSPGENAIRKINSDGFVSIRPVASMVIDQSKIKAFSGPVTGSIAVNVKQLSITTVNTNVATDTAPGSEITVYYRTGAGTFPVGLVARKFRVQLVTADGTPVTDLLNATDQYSGREQAGSSAGGLRSIKATIPSSVNSGTYRVRVITQGLIDNVFGTSSTTFTIRTNSPTVATIATNNISGTVCAGATVSFPFTTAGTFSAGNSFKVQLVSTDGSVLYDLPSTSNTSPIRSTLPTTLTTGTYRFQVMATATNVQSNVSSLSVFALPTMTISGSSTITAGNTATIRLDFTGIAPWSYSYTDNGTIRSGVASGSPTSITPTFTAPTTYGKSFISSFSDSRCGVSSFIDGAAQITVGQLVLATGTISGTYCPGSSVLVPFTTSSSLPSSVIYQVEISNEQGSFQNVQSIGTGTTSPIRVTIPTSLLAGIGYRVRVVVQKPTNSSLPDYSNSVNPVASSLAISRPVNPMVTDLSYCAGISTMPLSATGINLKWYTTNTSSQSLVGAPTPPNNQSSVYYVSQTINGCESARQPLSISITPIPSAPIVNNITMCQGGQGQLPTSIPNALWYSATSGGTGSSQPPTVNNQSVGDQTFYVTQTINGCESPRSAVRVVVNALPSAPLLPASISLCQNATANSLTAVGSSLTWYSSSGKLPGSPVPNTSFAGTQSYSVSQTVNTCEGPLAAIAVQIVAAPAPPLVANSRYCVGENPRSLTATGANLRWYSTTTGGSGSTNPPGFFTDAATTYNFYVSQTDANGCESTRQSMTVLIVAAPSAPSVNSVSICQGGQGQFSSSVPNALWYTSATGGNGSTQPPTLNNQTTGDQTVYVTQTVNGCESPRAAVKATIYAIPNAPAIPAPTYLCQFSSVNSLTAAGSNLNWYNQDGRLQGAPTPNTLSAGLQSYSITQTINNCESPRTTVSVIVHSAPTMPIANSVRFCVNDVPRSLTAGGSNLKWYTALSGGNSSTTSPAFFTESATVLTFYVTQTDSSGCESLRQPVSVSVVAPPSAPSVTSNQTICQSTKVGSLTASPNTGLIWQGPGIMGSSETAPVPNTSQPGIFTYMVAQKAGTCTGPTAQINITVVPIPTAPKVQSPIAFCIGTASIPLSATGSNLTWYTSADHTGSSFTQVIPNTNRANLTTHYVTQKDANNCESVNSAVEVRVSPRATATISGDGAIYPGDSTAIRVRLTGDAPWVFTTNWNSKQVTINNSKDSLYVAWVRPTATTTYTISNLTSSCGTGDVGAPYVLRVNVPLSLLPSPEPVSVVAYPNPTNGDLSVEWSASGKQLLIFQIINTSGVVIKQVTRLSSTMRHEEVFQLGDQPTGLYFLQIITPSNALIKKKILKL